MRCGLMDDCDLGTSRGDDTLTIDDIAYYTPVCLGSCMRDVQLHVEFAGELV